jgi:hypothetical protein
MGGGGGGNLSGQDVITDPVAVPDVSLQGGVNHFRSRAGRDAQTIADSLRRIQDGFDGMKASVEELQNALAPAGTGDEVLGIGDVRITSVLKTYDTIDDNNSVLVVIQVNFNSPSPTLDWDRVHVYIEVPEVSDPTPLDPTGGPVNAVGVYSGLVDGANTIYAWATPPSRQEGWRIYLVSGTPNAVKPLGLSTSLTPSPSSLLTVDPVPEGSSGEEWTSVTTGLSATVEYAVDMVGAVIFRIYGTFTPPSDVTYRGTLIVAKATTESDWRVLSTEPTAATTFTSTWMPVPDSTELWDVCTQAKGGTNRFNSIQLGGVTDCDQVTVEDQAGLGGLDLTRLNITTFNTDEFEVSGGAFQMNEISATKIVTGTLKVGGGATDKPGQMGVFDAADQLIGWVGEQGIYYGAWFKQLWVGGTDPTTAPLFTDSSGDLFMVDGAITINKTGGDTINIDTTNGFKYTDSATSDYAQFTDNYLNIVHSAGTEHMQLYPDQLSFTQPGTFLTSLDASSGHGELTLADGIGVTQPGVFMDGLEKHISVRDSGTSTTPDLLTGGTLASASKDPYWYDVDAASWKRLAYASELGTSPGGSNTHVQYNDSGSFGGESGFTYNDSTNALWVNGLVTGVGGFQTGTGNFNITSTGQYQMGGTTVVNSTRDVTVNSLSIDGAGSINSTSDANFNSLKINGTTIVDPSLSVFLRIYDQAAEPTITTRELSIWIDSDDSDRTYLIINNGTSTLKVELL